MRYGPPQSPPKEKKTAQSKKNQTARGQKERDESTMRTPSHSSMGSSSSFLGPVGEGHPRSAGRSRTTVQTRTASRRVKTPTATKENRHPIQELRSARGVAAVREPIPPIAMRMPVIMANSRTRNHSARTFIVGTKSMATPMPTRLLPTMAQRVVVAIPRRSDPTKAMQKKTVIVLRAPHESERRPAGSCISA